MGRFTSNEQVSKLRVFEKPRQGRQKIAQRVIAGEKNSLRAYQPRKGRQKRFGRGSVVPAGTRGFVGSPYPAMNRWAIICRPFRGLPTGHCFSVDLGTVARDDPTVFDLANFR